MVYVLTYLSRRPIHSFMNFAIIINNGGLSFQSKRFSRVSGSLRICSRVSCILRRCSWCCYTTTTTTSQINIVQDIFYIEKKMDFTDIHAFFIVCYTLQRNYFLFIYLFIYLFIFVFSCPYRISPSISKTVISMCI